MALRGRKIDNLVKSRCLVPSEGSEFEFHPSIFKKVTSAADLSS